MKYIKHELHGIATVTELKKAQKEAGWFEITAKELAKLCGAPDEESRETPDDVGQMTKRELEAHARTFNDAAGNAIELDRRDSKANMLKDFNEQLGD